MSSYTAAQSLYKLCVVLVQCISALPLIRSRRRSPRVVLGLRSHLHSSCAARLAAGSCLPYDSIKDDTSVKGAFSSLMMHTNCTSACLFFLGKCSDLFVIIINPCYQKSLSCLFCNVIPTNIMHSFGIVALVLFSS